MIQPYHTLGVADGLAFSCGNTKKEQPSLKQIFNAIQKDYPYEPYDRNPDLTRWAKQGVLLLNTALTAELNNPNQHGSIWAPFIAYVLDVLNSEKNNIVFVFMGAEAKRFSTIISDRHFCLFVEHPQKPNYEYPKRDWNHQELFLKVNIFLNSKKEELIAW